MLPPWPPYSNRPLWSQRVETRCNYTNERNVLVARETQEELHNQGVRRQSGEQGFRRCWNQGLESHSCSLHPWLCFVQRAGRMLLFLGRVALSTRSRHSVYHTLLWLTYLFSCSLSVSLNTMKFIEGKVFIHLLISIFFALTVSGT